MHSFRPPVRSLVLHFLYFVCMYVCRDFFIWFARSFIRLFFLSVFSCVFRSLVYYVLSCFMSFVCSLCNALLMYVVLIVLQGFFLPYAVYV